MTKVGPSCYKVSIQTIFQSQAGAVYTLDEFRKSLLLFRPHAKPVTILTEQHPHTGYHENGTNILTQDSDAAPPEKKEYKENETSPWAWYMIFILTIVYTFSFIDRSILSLLVGPIRNDLQISDTEFSLLHGLAFALFYTFMGVPIARFADSKNRRNIIALGVFLWSLMTAFCGLARSFWQLFLARIGVGVGEAALSPAAYSMIADSFPQGKLGMALGIYSTGIFIGTGLAFMIGGVVIETVSTAGAFDLPLLGTIQPWQVTFIIVGLPGLIVAAFVMTLREPRRKSLLRRDSSEGLPLGVVWQFLRARTFTFLAHFFGFSMLALLFQGIIAWAPEYFIRTFGMARTEIGLWLGLIVGIFGSLGIISGGLLTDYLIKRGYADGPLRAGLIGGLVLTPIAIVTTLASSSTVSLILFCPFMFFASFPFGPAAAALQLISPNEMRAQISALYLFVINLAGIGFAPTATALITDYVFQDDMMLRYSMSLLGALSGTAACIILWIGLKPFRESAEQAETAF
jgi:MFS family permease